MKKETYEYLKGKGLDSDLLPTKLADIVNKEIEKINYFNPDLLEVSPTTNNEYVLAKVASLQNLLGDITTKIKVINLMAEIREDMDDFVSTQEEEGESKNA